MTTTTTTDHDSYLAKPAITTRTRRLFTFTTPLYVQVSQPTQDGCDYRLQLQRITAAEGMEEEADEGCRFLCLERLYLVDGGVVDLSGPEHRVLGVWVQEAAMASAQIQILPWTIPDLRTLQARCGDELQPGITCVLAEHHIGAHRDRGGQRCWGG